MVELKQNQDNRRIYSVNLIEIPYSCLVCVCVLCVCAAVPYTVRTSLSLRTAGPCSAHAGICPSLLACLRGVGRLTLLPGDQVYAFFPRPVMTCEAWSVTLRRVVVLFVRWDGKAVLLLDWVVCVSSARYLRIALVVARSQREVRR